MKQSRMYFLGALGALSLAIAAPVGAECTYPTVLSEKGTISGIFYDATGVATKVKCDASAERGDFVTITWNGCPGLSTYGGSVFLRAGQAERIVKNGVPQKTCVVSNRYYFLTPPPPEADQRMTVTAVSLVTTADSASPTTVLKEKGTLNFTRTDGVFSGKFSFTYPKP